MKVKLQVSKNGSPLYVGDYDISDAEDFGKACADAWAQLQQAQLNKEPSIGALIEHINNSVLDQLSGASISVTKV